MISSELDVVMADSLKQIAIKGIGWSAIERFSVQGVTFIVQIVLARLLAPDDFGVIGMLTIFLQVAQVFIDSGFANNPIFTIIMGRSTYFEILLRRINYTCIKGIVNCTYCKCPFNCSKNHSN